MKLKIISNSSKFFSMIIIKVRNFLNECKIEYQDGRRQKMCISLARHHASFRICQKLICTFKYCGFDGFFILFISNNCLTLLCPTVLDRGLGATAEKHNWRFIILMEIFSKSRLVLRHIVPTSESKSFFVEVQQNVSRSSCLNWFYFFPLLRMKKIKLFFRKIQRKYSRIFFFK